MANELGQSCVVQAAVAQRDVTLDLGTAVDALHQVTLMKPQSKDRELFTSAVEQLTDVQSELCVRYLQVLVNGAVLVYPVERDAVEG